MLSSVLRIVARAATIQLEEVSARHGPALARRGQTIGPRDPDQYPPPPPIDVYSSTQPTLDRYQTPAYELEVPPIRRGDRLDEDPEVVLRQNRERRGLHGVVRDAGHMDQDEGQRSRLKELEATSQTIADIVSQQATLAAAADREVGDQKLGQEEPKDGLKESFRPRPDTPSPVDVAEPSTSPAGEATTSVPPSEGTAAVTPSLSSHPTPTGKPTTGINPGVEQVDCPAVPPQSVSRALPEMSSQDSSTPSEAYKMSSQHDSAIETAPEDSRRSTASATPQAPLVSETSGRQSDTGSALLHESAADPFDSPDTAVDDIDENPVLLRASKVPSSRIGRLFHYGSLAASLSWGAASESIRRTAGGSSTEGSSVFMSDANIRRLVSSLTRMRGAALKLGQFMSIQDNNMLPPEIEKVLQQVQAHANYMPDWQMEKVLKAELGPEWQTLFSSFDRTPIASASIGQVHRATLASSGDPVAVKIQFPGIEQSISSDLSYLTPLLAGSSILPRGLYLQNTVAVMKRELADECDYLREAEAGRRFGKMLEGDEYFTVPRVIDEASTSKVLTTEWMAGKSLSRMKNMSQETRDKIGTNVLRLCLQELFHFRFMQTDPNWANFLYNPSTDRLGLIDFGASREYTPEFMDSWHALLTAALNGDREAMKEQSLKIGYFTGQEEEVMIDAHLASMSLLAVPFSHDGPYDFSKQTITTDVRKYIPIMLKHRLTPPPPETYSLNRKLSGAFLMCARLGSRVDCSKLWRDWVAGHPYSKVSS